MSMQPYVLVLAQTSHEGAKYVRRAKLQRGRWRVVGKASSIRGIRQAEVHCLPGFHKRPDRHSIIAELRYAKCDWVDVEMPPREVPDAVDQGDGMGEQLSIEDAPSFPQSFVPTMETGPLPDGELLFRLTDEDVAELTAIPWTIDERSLEVAYRYNRLLDRAAHEAYLETILEPEGWEPPETLDAEQILRLAAGESGAEVAPMTERMKTKRRRKCADCGTLHLKDEACPRIDGVEETPVANPATMFD